jgi:hypothetical protein
MKINNEKSYEEKSPHHLFFSAQMSLEKNDEVNV